jgi:hypothetical protein
VRCSTVARAAGEDPAGSAPSPARYLLVEVPLPWPPDALRARGAPPGLAKVCARASRAGVLPLAIAPSDPTGPTRVVHLSRPNGPFAAFGREEYLVPPGRVAALVAALMDGTAGSFAAHRVDGAERDLLVCTHGSEDACCGQLGGRLFELARREHGGVPGLRVWRASHFGGHRFAPTLVDLPTGECWAHVDADALRAVVRREGPLELLGPRMRGWGGFGFFPQLVGREAFLREGWDWTALPKAGRARVLDPPGCGADALANPVFTDRPVRRVAVDVTVGPAAYQGVVELTGSAPGIGACGAGGWRRNTYEVVSLGPAGAGQPAAPAIASMTANAGAASM